MAIMPIGSLKSLRLDDYLLLVQFYWLN